MPLNDITGLKETSSASISSLDLVKGAFALTVNGATHLMDDKYRNPNYYDSNFSILNPESQALMDSFNIPAGERSKYTDSMNIEHLYSVLERNKFYQESAANLNQELPIAQYPLMMATSILDPVDLMLMPLGFKALGSIKAISDTTRLNNVIKSGVSTGVSATTSEALLADYHNVDTSLATTAVVSSVLGGGLGAFLPIINKAGSIESHGKMLDELHAKPATEADFEAYAKNIHGYNDFDHIKAGVANKIEGWKKYFVWSPGAKLMKSDNPAARAVSHHADKVSLATTDGKGNITPAASSTAMETKQDLMGQYVTDVMKPMVEHYKEYRANGGTLKGSEWLEDLGVQYREHLGKIEDDVWNKYDLMTQEERIKLYSSVQKEDFKFDPNDIPEDFHVVNTNLLSKEIEKLHPLEHKTLQGVQTYFHKQQQFGEAIEFSALKGRNGRTYLNRMLSRDKIDNMKESDAVDILYNAMKNSNVTKRRISELLKEGKEQTKILEELREHAADIVARAKLGSVFDEMQFRDNITSPVGGQFFKARHMNIDERLATEILENDLSKLTSYYSYKTAPKLALKKHLNIETKGDIDELLATVEREGRKVGQDSKTISKDLDNIRYLIDTINGTREIAQNPNSFIDKGVRVANKFNYITLGGGFGLNTLAEIGTGVMTHGIKYFKQAVPAFNETIAMYRKSGTRQQTNELLGLGLAESIYRSNKVQRYDSLDMFSSSGKLESILDRGSDMMSNVSGLNFMTTFLEQLSHASAMEDMVTMANKVGKLSRSEQKRLARLGLTEQDLLDFKQVNKVQYDENGYLLSYNYEQWGDAIIAQKIRNGIREMVKNAVIQADPTSLPVFATSSHPFAKLFLQFLRFPMAAHERILLKGLDEFNGRVALGALVSTGTMAMVFSLREEAMIKAGFIDERDRKYDLATDDGIKNMAGALATKMPYLGFTQPVADMFLKYTGFAPDYGRDTLTTMSPTISRIEGLKDVIGDLHDGKLSNRSANFLRYGMPFSTIPVVNEVTKSLVEKD